MARFRFRTRFTTSASPSDAFATIVAPERWLDRWDHVVDVDRLDTGDPLRPAFDARVRGPAGYTIGATVTTASADAPHAARMVLDGDLVGDATWALVGHDGGTDVDLVMDVHATRSWMVALAPVARPLFEWSHRVVVRHAVEAATESIGAELLSFSSDAEDPPD